MVEAKHGFKIWLLIILTLSGIFLSFTVAFFTHNVQQQKIVVFAGAAAAPVYEEASLLFEERYGVHVELRLGGSGSLLSSIYIAKTGDVYIPGSPEFLLKARELGVINASSARVYKLAYLVPAIIVQKGNPKNITRLEDLKSPNVKVGIADPESVCVGLYARELLERNGLWDDVRKNIVTFAQSCDATAALVYTGAVDAVVGWHVFYYWNPEKADIVWIDPMRIDKIGYIAGTVTIFSKDTESSVKFLEFLTSDDVKGIWAKYGYFPTLEAALIFAPNAELEELW